MTDLAVKSCVPCQGGVPALSKAAAEPLLRTVAQWSLNDEATRIERRFAFKDFKTALAFVDGVGEIAEAEQHHPDITFGWGYAIVSVFTHKIKGLHKNDFILAAKCDRLFASKAQDAAIGG